MENAILDFAPKPLINDKPTMHSWQQFFLFLFIATICPAVAKEHWFFLPNYHHDIRGVEKPPGNEEPFFESLPKEAERLAHEGSGLTEAQRRELFWHAARFPHRDFVKLMPERNVFGWYACHFDMPSHLLGLDVIVDLGIIDDTDETFVNGTRVGGVGQLGQSHPAAWQMDRHYRVPKDLLVPLDNHLAVHVWSLWGLGGLVGPPVIKATPVPADAKWEIAFVQDAAAPAKGLDKAQTLEKAFPCFSSKDKLDWKRSAQPWQEYASWKEDVHYALFKLPLDFPQGKGSFPMPVILDVGPVFDVAAFYLNGKRLGQVGRFPDGKEPAFTEAAHRARFLVNPGDWAKDGRNELVAVVYRERGVGGLPGIPGILLANPLVERHPNFDEIQDGFDIFVQSGLLDEAEKLLAKARPTSRTERAWFLSHKAHLAFLRWRDGGNKGKRLLDNILAPVAEILKELPSESPKQSAMQAFCRVLRLAEKEGKTWKAVKRHFPRFSAGCQCLDSDRTTRGDWQLHYGRNFHVLAAMGQKCDWTGGDDCSLFAYQLQIPGGKDSPRLWLPQRQREVGHPSALLMPYSYKHALAQRNGLDDNEVTASLLPGVNIRRASWWDDHGEMHPFDDEGPDFLVSLQMPSGRHLVSFYLQDYDWRHTLHPRQQSCMLFDHSGHLLNAVWGGKLDEGAYSRFLVSGETHIRTRFNKHRGACVAVNGVFADSAAPIDPNCLDCAREIAPIAREIAVAESSFDTFRAVKQIHDRLHGIDSLEALGKLLTAVDGMEAVHPCWHYLVVARMLNLMRNRENADMGNALEVISRSCRESTSYPLLGITANFMAGRGFSQDDPLLIKIRNAVPFPFHAPAAPNSQGGLQ